MKAIEIKNDLELENIREELILNLAEQQIKKAKGIKDREQTAEISALGASIKRYEEEQAKSNRRATRINRAIENILITPVFRMIWTVMIGVGIFFQEKVKPFAIGILGPLKTFLFPLHFSMEIVRSLWDLKNDIQDKYKAQRKTSLAVNALTLAGMIACIPVFFLTTNPFALPIAFLGMVGAGLYKEVYAYHQNQKWIKQTKAAIHTVESNLQALSVVDGNHEEIEKRLILKRQRLESQLSTLKKSPFEMPRRIFLNAVTLASVSLLITSAVMTLVFPPLAATLSTTGLLIFGATAISSILTSPSVIEKAKGLFKGIKNLVSPKRTLHELREPLLQENNNAPRPTVRVIANATPQAQEARVVRFRARSKSFPGFFNGDLKSQRSVIEKERPAVIAGNAASRFRR